MATEKLALHTSIINNIVEEIRRCMPPDDPAWADLGNRTLSPHS